jgi:hypothetical protein
VIVRVIPSLVPLTAIGYVPIAVDGATATVIVELPEPGAAMDVGFKLTASPGG